MRITLVTETYVPEINGVAKTLARLVQELTSRGHQIHIVRPRQKTESEHHFEPNTTHVRGASIPGYSGLQFGFPAAAKLMRLWKSETPQAIYVATEGPLGWSAVTTANKLKIPVLSGFHTNYHAYSKHYRMGWLESAIFYYLKYFHNKTAATLAPSPSLVAQLTLHGIDNVDLFTRGIDTITYHPQHRDPELRKTWGAGEHDRVVLYVGRIAAEKNINLVIAAWHHMQQKDPGIRLVMVGDGPLLARMKKKHPDIIFCGAKIDQELSQHYASADLFLFGSETETFGNVVLEAMASGLAVLAFDYAAARMHIRNRQNGVVVELGNRQQFIEAACKLTDDRELIHSIRLQARLCAEKKDWKNVIDHFEKQVASHVKSLSSDQQRHTEIVPVDGQA
ncbi:MAG TPA: glycosyltransferase family 1 protein [Gammaproteobacteria bacterium]|nr:glycosyltransferase family 1 protein [Gammaproteobacteria bacterium]